ncbi:hypothetical protein FHU33_3302 [Blastococcus colisei]|uniref:DUF3887 domain-containing protein n=1 Tax=Blastococcus colisei TaxID=1564162 RepID=A0A543PIF3_9ACTN|nr:hypothetical protein [Blastococcus colisei]TQN43834.1 hypothetical protein FHU33_3302 [Blastococcus colisei]
MTVLVNDDGAADSAVIDPGARPRGRGKRRRGLWAGALIALVTVTVVLLLNDRAPDGPVERSAASPDDAVFEPFVEDSAFRALEWVSAMAEGGGLPAWVQMCDAAHEEYGSAFDGRLQAEFEGFLGGRLVSAEVVDAVVVDGRYYVTMSGTVESGADVEVMVSVVSEEWGMSVCGFGHPSQIP